MADFEKVYIGRREFANWGHKDDWGFWDDLSFFESSRLNVILDGI